MGNIWRGLFCVFDNILYVDIERFYVMYVHLCLCVHVHVARAPPKKAKIALFGYVVYVGVKTAVVSCCCCAVSCLGITINNVVARDTRPSCVHVRSLLVSL